MSLMPIKGTTIPPSPYISRLRRNNAAALMGRYFTPRSASGINAMMIKALKITAERIADCGVRNPMMLSVLSTGNAAANIAGMIAKYFATSFAIENVVNTPRVIGDDERRAAGFGNVLDDARELTGHVLAVTVEIL